MAAAAATAAQPGLAAIVAWASAALSAALTVFLLCAIPTLVVWMVAILLAGEGDEEYKRKREGKRARFRSPTRPQVMPFSSTSTTSTP